MYTLTPSPHLLTTTVLGDKRVGHQDVAVLDYCAVQNMDSFGTSLQTCPLFCLSNTLVKFRDCIQTPLWCHNTIKVYLEGDYYYYGIALSTFGKQIQTQKYY